MLRSREELERTQELLERTRNTLASQHAHYQEQNYTPEQLERATSVMRVWEAQLIFEIQEYERNIRGDFGPSSFSSLGRQLIALRLARGLSQKDLALRLRVSEAQVSRDETNEYRNISPQKAQRILDVLGAQVEIQMTLAPQLPEAQSLPVDAIPKKRGRPTTSRSAKTPSQIKPNKIAA